MTELKRKYHLSVCNEPPFGGSSYLRSIYFALPPNPLTKPGKRHGIHYIKLFPVDKMYIQPYKISKSGYLVMVKSILDKNESKIVDACQNYLNQYEKGKGNKMTPDIDGILSWLLC